ncbi:lipid-A-disaccharide synthase [Verticiella sediminum]|uniref:Lipid-A-disaccharide synthase n=1 Tax=Verticiella sediminum TaxID=1247510 RepID=A0A556ABT4_9BURK|nr:lipid-A-disaccharide synthase [Verticiella sediminum]TSH90333.1 lipid-A-disaccharide synthase [Verticiella sediminum]
MALSIGMIAGEPSGDLLAAQVMRGLAAARPDLRCAGIGGPRMREAGLDAWYPMDSLSIFGYVDALRRLPSLFAMRADVRRRWVREPPAAFVGIDAPDFNLGLEAALRARGVPTVHFVGPSIWAWRGERIHAIKRAVSHMLVVFPFEEAIYREAGIPVTYVGHPLASVIPEKPDKAGARARLGVPAEARVLALMPGSRRSELHHLGPRFLAAAKILLARDPELLVLAPMVNAERETQFRQQLSEAGLTDRVRCVPGGAYEVMAACDAVLVASGTATLEAALFKRPMVIAYVVSALALWIMRRKSGQERPYLPWVGLPNVLARDFLVPEFLQDAATPQALAEAIWPMLTEPARVASLQARFAELHASLKCDTAGLAAQRILEVAERGA